MEKFMTKEFAPGLALDTGELIPASDLNAQIKQLRRAQKMLESQ